MPVKSIVIGWDFEQIGDQKESFIEGFTEVFSSASGRAADFVTDREHIQFVSEKDEIDRKVEQGVCDIIVCSETLSGEANIGYGSMKQWKKGGVQKIILILDDTKKGKGKVKSLFDNGFYDMLFESDFKGKNLIALLLKGRTKEAACSYYGLEGYKDLLTEEEAPVKDAGKGEKGNDSSKAAPSEVKNKKERRDGRGGKAREPASDEPQKKRKDKNRKADKEDNAPQAKDTKDKRKEKADAGEGKEKNRKEGISAKNKGKDNDESIVEDIDTLDIDKPLSSLKDVIRQQKDIGKAMYSVKKSKNVDLSKEVTGFLKPDYDPIEYIRAMEKATHVDPTDREKPLNQKDSILEELLSYYTTQDKTWMSNLQKHLSTRADWDAELRQRISGYGVTAGISEGVQDQIFKEFNEFMFGYDFLGDLIRDPLVTDIKVLAYDSVLVKRKGKRVPEDRTFRSPEHFTAFIAHIARRNHVNIQNNAAVKFMDTKCFEEARLRVNIQTEYINCSGIASLHIRKENNKKYTTQDLVDAKMMDYKTAAYLIYKAREDTGILFVGGNAQGKTSVFNWLIDFVPYTATGQVIQESDELFSKYHKYLQFLQVTDDEEGNIEDGQGVYDLRRLSALGLKTDNDYFMIGEITGAEAKYFINYVFTGSRCWASVHGMDARAGLPKIADYGMYESEYTYEQLLEKLLALKVIVYIENFQIKEIIEVAGWDAEKNEIIYKDIPIVVPEKIEEDEDGERKAG